MTDTPTPVGPYTPLMRVGGFLLTQVEYEGGMSGWNEDLVAQAVQAAGSVRITAAGGITTAEDVGQQALFQALVEASTHFVAKERTHAAPG